MEFKAVILSEIGDYLLKEKQDFEWTEKGLKLENPYIVNEEGLAQQVKADTLLITRNALQGIQEGLFEEEIVE
ncbi:MAG: hypothetical protein ACLFRK_03240 [Candidatus Nanohaloarchaea archaeon]